MRAMPSRHVLLQDGSDAREAATEECSAILNAGASGSPRSMSSSDVDQAAVSTTCDAGVATCTAEGEGSRCSTCSVHVRGAANGHAIHSSSDPVASDMHADGIELPTLPSTTTEVFMAPIAAHASTNEEVMLVPNFQIHPSYPVEIQGCSTTRLGGRPNTRVPASIPPEKWVKIAKKLQKTVAKSYPSPWKQLHDGFICCTLVILCPPSLLCFFDEVCPCIFHSPGDRAVRKVCSRISRKDLAGLGVEVSLSVTQPDSRCGTRVRRLEVRPISAEENARRAEAANVPVDAAFKAPSADEMEREIAGQCRICLDEESEPVLILPCQCTGGMHRECLVRWQQHKLKARQSDDHAPSISVERCEICRAPWKFVIPQLQED